MSADQPGSAPPPLNESTAAEVFRVTADTALFQALSPVDPTVWSSDRLVFDARPKREWRTLETYLLNPQLREGHFLYLCPGALVLDEHAYACMADLLERAGELLPVSLNTGRSLFLLNVTICVDAVDVEKSEWTLSATTGKRLELKRYTMLPERLPESTLFKVVQTVRGDVLTLTDGSAADSFIQRYRSANLSGLSFQRVG